MSSQEDLQLSQSFGDDLFIPPEDILLLNGVPLGSGSFGEVYRGYTYHQEVAIKRLFHGVAAQVAWEMPDKLTDDPNQRVAFFERNPTLFALEGETFFLKQLRHQNIISFLGCCLDPPVLVTEYCSRGSIYDLIQKVHTSSKYANKFDWKKRIDMAVDAASGMNYLHSREPPVLHMDLKSPNLLVDKRWTCKVADFGTCNFVDPQRRRACMRVNNPCWRAPEVIEGKPHTKASDVYPFGIILWELLTLRRPFEDEEGNIPDATQIWASVMIHDARPGLQDDGSSCASMVCPVAEEYTQLIKRCWDRVPEKRPTYEEILDELVKMQYKVHGRPQKEQYPVPVSALKNELKPWLDSDSHDQLDSVVLEHQPGISKTPAAHSPNTSARSRPFLRPFETVSTEPSTEPYPLPITKAIPPRIPVPPIPERNVQKWFRKSVKFVQMALCFKPRIDQYSELPVAGAPLKSSASKGAPFHRSSKTVNPQMVIVKDVLNVESPFVMQQQQLSLTTPFVAPPQGLAPPSGPTSQRLLHEVTSSPNAAVKSVVLHENHAEQPDTPLLAGRLEQEHVLQAGAVQEMEKGRNEDESKCSSASTGSLSKTASTASDSGRLVSHPLNVSSLLRDSINDPLPICQRALSPEYSVRQGFDLPGRNSLTIQNLVSSNDPALVNDVNPVRVRSLVRAVSRVQSKCKTMGRGTGLRLVHQDPPAADKWMLLRDHILKPDVRDGLLAKEGWGDLVKFVEENSSVPEKVGWTRFAKLVFGAHKNSKMTKDEHWGVVTEVMVGEAGVFSPPEMDCEDDELPKPAMSQERLT